MPRRPKTEHSFRSYVLWDLKLRGDINENHQGGNALTTLRERMSAHGAPADGLAHLATVVAQLATAGKVTRLAKGRRTHAIRLVRDIRLPENPYPDEGLEIVDAEVLPEKYESLINGHRDWPISRRLQLIAELSQSVHEDIERAKANL